MPQNIAEEIVQIYPSLIEFPPVTIPIFSKEADAYFGFETKIKYSIPFPKRLFSVIKGCPWLKKYFGFEPWVQKRFVERSFVVFSRSGTEKLPSICSRCYIHSEFYPSNRHHIQTTHTIFQGTPDELFDKIFCVNMWCTRCRRTPLFDMYDPEDCKKLYGNFAHLCCRPGFGCFSCTAGERLMKVWFEELSDVIDYDAY